jgi:hypothetical protein
MKKLLAALVTAVLSLTVAAPAVAADRPDKKAAEKSKKDEKKKSGSSQAPKAGYDQTKNKKQ